MILKVGNGVVVNWDNVSAVLTNDRNFVDCSYMTPGKDSEMVLKRGDAQFHDRPFEIIIKVHRDEYVAFRTSDSAEMWAVYNEILQALTSCLRRDATFCDISEICAHADMTNRITHEEMLKIMN